MASKSQYGANNENLPENLVLCLQEIIDKKKREDDYIRKQQIKNWKKLERFWHGIQFIFWSETQQDWIAPINTRYSGDIYTENREGAEGPFYDYVINIFRAHGESIIAALSNQVPAVRFPPDDADSEDDLATSKTYSKIADLITRHNKGKMLLLQALLFLWNQGIVCAYHAPKADKAFGNIDIPNHDFQQRCPSCGYIADDAESSGDAENVDQANTIKNSPDTGEEVQSQEAQPDTENPQEDQSQENQQTCPQCGQPMQLTPVITGFTSAPKSRVLVDIYGPLFVKIPYYSRTQNECGYLGLMIDQPISKLKTLFPHIADEIDSGGNSGDIYEKIGRSPSQYLYTVNDNQYLRTLERWWLRTSEFECLSSDKDEEKKQLLKLFPDGAYVCQVGTVYAESRNEDLDKYWTIGKAGLSTYIHSDPLGEPLVPVQEMRNVLTNLTLETVEQGIATVFADPDVLDFDDFSQHELRPGTYVPAKAPKDKSMNQAFYEGPKATLSKDVPVFGKQLDQDGQFVVGSFPSIFGGPSEGNSRTASEYEQSRQMAMQRLSITWTMLNYWWASLMEKCVKLYVETLVTDERYVIKEKENYVNVWIRQEELTGKVGEVEAEGAETFPVTTAQKQGLLFKLIGLNNEMLNAALFDVENRKVVADSLSFPELSIPDENQRIKQAREIQWMVDKHQETPIEPNVDDDNIHILVLRDFMCSAKGLDLKVNDPQSYSLLDMHLNMHLQNQAMKMSPNNPILPGNLQPPVPIPGQPAPQGPPNAPGI